LLSPTARRGHAEGRLFSRVFPNQPRQEPGRYFVLTDVPSLDEPQRQPKRPEPEFTAHVAGVVALDRGESVTRNVATDDEMFWIVAVTIPFEPLDTPATYFEATPSPPQLFAAGCDPPD
jgi:hypothetical protein